MSRHADYLNLFDVRREEWDPNDDTPPANRTVKRIDRFEAHHTGGSGPLALSFEAKRGWARGVERYHQFNKGWTDIFYHVFIFADGEIWEGRRIDRTSQADIPTTVTVHYPGNDPVVTQAQADSAMRVARWAVTDPNRISYHSARAASSCPGDNVRQHIHELREGFNVTNFPPIQLIPEDLRHHEDYLAAITKGFISDADPDRVASRSVAAVIANRAHDDALAYFADLEARVNDLEEDTNVEIVVTADVIDVIILEIIKRLGE